ncbi:hypothetical protein BH20ACT3_BH20ACT3_06860 [soil metagenome]
MFRRRRPLLPPTPDPVEAAIASPGDAPATPDPPADLAATLADEGWILPRTLAEGASPRWTLVGTVASPTATSVDPTGLVCGDAWSLDWWIGADDRWHLPAQEPAVRQRLVDEAPVVETLVRIPGGDAVHRGYGIRSPRPVGDEWVVAEITNATAIPFAVALVVRPFVADAVGAVSRITVEATEGGSGRDIAHVVRVDGRSVAVVPRRPARLAAGSRAAGDVVEVVSSGAAGTELIEATCPDGLATLAMVFPLTHTSVLRVALPVGEGSEAGDHLAYPAVLPAAVSVASGWELHRRGPRFEIPDAALNDAMVRARAQIQLAHSGDAVRRDGHRMADLDPVATEVLLGAFDLLDRPAEVGAILARWTARWTDPEPDRDTMLLAVVARHWSLHRIDELLDWVLPQVAGAVGRLDRADRRRRLASTASRRRAAHALADTASMLAAAHQPKAATEVAALGRRIGADLAPHEPATAAERLLATGGLVAACNEFAVAELHTVVAEASPTGAWPGPGHAGRPAGHDLVAAAALITAVRSMLVSERPDGLALLPVHPDTWYGGGVEVHDAPTAFGSISYAVRWHGTRPALLWDLVAHPEVGEVRLRAPGLDPAWSTTEARGDALLSEVAPPADAQNLAVVAEHSEPDAAMRRPGSTPTEVPGDLPPMPEGGTFS